MIEPQSRGLQTEDTRRLRLARITKSAAALRDCLQRTPYAAAALIFGLHLLLGAWYAGPTFFANFASSIPSAPAGGGEPRFMTPGDHFEQLYRYALPRNNLARGRPPYDSGYQYNFQQAAPPFTEGPVFFPFSAIHAVFAAVIGDIAAYNLLALLSFPLVGCAMYALVFWLTRSHASALLASLVLALLPHRTSFLFGEMVFGVDLMFAPLAVLAFERLLASRTGLPAAAFGTAMLFYATSTIQGFYQFAVFSSAYFAVRGLQFVLDRNVPRTERIRTAAFAFVALLPAAGYVVYLSGVLAASGLSGGQHYQELLTYAPKLENALVVWSGNEKSVYFGFALVALLALALAMGLRQLTAEARQIRQGLASILALAGFSFVVSYLFCFGPNLDAALGVEIYRWYFDHVPGANGSRTPGRMMGTAAFHFALVAGICVAAALRAGVMLRPGLRWVPWTLVALCAIAIARDYHYTRPVMVALEPENAALRSIAGSRGIVFAVPVRREAEHFHNATWLYYAQKYDLRFFAGHSSIYPKEWNRIIDMFLPLNSGLFEEPLKAEFVRRGITHVAVRTTSAEPRVGQVTRARLLQNPHLRLVAEAGDVSVFAVDKDATGPVQLDLRRLSRDAKQDPATTREFEHLDGWYSREAYPGQAPFRWMRGTQSSATIYAGSGRLAAMRFVYKCPHGPLSVRVNGEEPRLAQRSLEGGWQDVKVDLPDPDNGYYLVEFSTPTEFKVPRDQRRFGCMVGDVTVQ